MTPFKELQNLADDIRKKTGKSCCVSVEYWAFHTDGQNDLRYNLYTEGPLPTATFLTVEKLIVAMKDVRNPPKDPGITLSDK